MVNQIAKLAEDDQYTGGNMSNPNTKTQATKLKKKQVLVLSVCIPKVKL